MNNEFPIQWRTEDGTLVEQVKVSPSTCSGCFFYQEGYKCPTYDEGQYYCDNPSSIWKEVKSQDNFNGTSQSDFETMKKENPEVGKKYDAGKPMYNLLPPDALEEVVKVLTVGAIRYNEPIDQENWRLVENPQSRYFAAAQRHQWADRRGELIDVDKVNPDGTVSQGTNCYHLACAIASLMFKLQLRIEEQRNKE